MLKIFSTALFYTDFVCLPDMNAPIPKYIQDNPKFYPFFYGAIGALDGTHFDCSGTPEQQAIAHDHKGHVIQNCLAACDFTHKFVYVFSRWEGSITDSTMFNDARITNLYIPTACSHYSLADAGFPNSISLLLPYLGVHYHLQEWSCADLWCVYSTSSTLYCTEIPPALAAIHNFIREYNGEELEDLLHQDDADGATEPSHHEATGD